MEPSREGNSSKEIELTTHRRLIDYTAREEVLGRHISLVGPINSFADTQRETVRQISILEDQVDDDPDIDDPDIGIAKMDIWGAKLSSLRTVDNKLAQLQLDADITQSYYNLVSVEPVVKQQSDMSSDSVGGNILATGLLRQDVVLRQKFFLTRLEGKKLERSELTRLISGLLKEKDPVRATDVDLEEKIDSAVKAAVLLGYGTYSEMIGESLRAYGLAMNVDKFLSSESYVEGKKKLLAVVVETANQYSQFKEDPSSAQFLNIPEVPGKTREFLKAWHQPSEQSIQEESALELVREGRDPLGLNYAFLIGKSMAQARWQDAAKLYSVMAKTL